LDSFDRYVKDFILWELKILRPGWTAPAWERDQPLNSSPFFLDSLELVELAGSLAQRFHVVETGAEDYFLARRTPREWAELLRYTRTQGIPNITFSSSGSTGEPQFYTHSWSSLEREAGYFVSLITGRKRLVKTIPSHHIYGFLFTWLFPEIAGIPVVEQSSESPAWEAGDLVVTVPFLLGHWLKRHIPIPHDVVFSLSTAPFPIDAAESLLKAGGKYYEIYGSSETGGIGFRTEPYRGFKLLPWWNTDGTQSMPRLQREDGLLFDFPDEIEIPSPGFVVPKKRRDGAIQVGGVNVFPSRVKAVLEQHPAVSEAAVRPTNDGSSLRLKAFIVPRNLLDLEDEQKLDHILRDWATQQLMSVERPVHYTFGSSLPRSPMGKDADW